MKIAKKIREAVAGLSTQGRGSYYRTPYQWYEKVATVLQENGLTLQSECPQFFNEQGRSALHIEGVDSQVWFTYFRMASGNWEIIGYLT